MHLADAFIQSDLQYIQVIHFFGQYNVILQYSNVMLQSVFSVLYLYLLCVCLIMKRWYCSSFRYSLSYNVNLQTWFVNN